MKVLLVIDLQKDFEGALNKRTISNCSDLIRKAMRKKEMIIFITIKGRGPLDARLLKLTENYSNHYHLVKYGSSGGMAIKKFLCELGVTPSLITVCGCYTDCCVLNTVATILKYGYNINVVKNACFPSYGWSYYKRLPKQEQLSLHG